MENNAARPVRNGGWINDMASRLTIQHWILLPAVSPWTRKRFSFVKFMDFWSVFEIALLTGAKAFCKYAALIERLKKISVLYILPICISNILGQQSLTVIWAAPLTTEPQRHSEMKSFMGTKVIVCESLAVAVIYVFNSNATIIGGFDFIHQWHRKQEVCYVRNPLAKMFV